MTKSSNIENFKFIDLFAGIGGFRIALEKYGLECVFTSEWDSEAKNTYKNNFGEEPNGDITKINEEMIPQHNIICAGFPCQAFSIAGKQKGFDDTRGTLFFDVARIAKKCQPEILFLENVKNFAKHDNGRTLKIVLNTLESINYKSYYKVLNASDYGIATSRERIYIVAFRKDLNINNFEFPRKNKCNVKLRDYLETEYDVPNKLFIERSDIKLNETKIQIDRNNAYPQKPIRIGTINKGGQGERIYSDLGHAITLSAYGGGAGSKTGAYLINNRIRKLTPRECARIMGFPETFKLPTSITQAHKQLGNSVAIPMLEKIFAEIIKVYNKEHGFN